MLSNALYMTKPPNFMILAYLPKRGTDDWGSGAFGASRGSRKHKGIDYACYPDTAIMSSIKGIVTKLGYPYADDLSYRYVEVTDNAGARHRYFYVEPELDVGDEVTIGSRIGRAQDIAARYPDPNKGPMKNHIHYEILVNNEPVDPEQYEV